MEKEAVGEGLVRKSEFIRDRRKYGIKGVGKNTLDTWIRIRVIPSVKLGRVVMVDPIKARAALDRYERPGLDTTRSLRALTKTK